MRNLPLAAAVSAVVHTAVVAWLAVRSPARRNTAAAPATTPIEIATVAPQPPPAAETLDVVLLEPRPAAVAPPDEPAPLVGAAPRPRHAAQAHEHAVTSVRPGAGPADAAEATRHAPTHSALLAMRRGEAPSTALPSSRWDDLDHAPRGTAPARDRPTGTLHESGGGSYRSDQGAFEVNVNPDGTVALNDGPNLRVHLALPTPKSLGRALARWYESDKGESGAEGDPAMARQIQVTPGATTSPPDPTASQPRDRTPTAIVPVVAGNFDVSDWLMRNHGQDPYAARKLALLDATRDERAEVGRRHRDAELARSADLVERSLRDLWAAPRDLRARKQALFELWDDCAETGDAAVVAAGEVARRLVIGFIRSHLPAGSADAFTPAELAALARTRQSKAAFRPYE